jgi:cytochrome c
MFKRVFALSCLMSVPALAVAQDGDAAAGEKVFRKCQACHMVGEDAQNRVGPMLNGVVGRAVGAVEGFKYSSGFEERAAAGETWTPEALDAFLEKPRDYVKGTKMAFAGLRKEEERANVIAYLASFGE